MLTLNDGRSELWQWDTGRKLTVDAECSQVHFSNKVFGRSIDVDVVDGVAIIPDILLQTDKDLTAWAFVGTAEDGYTKISKVFKVNRRNKPADYVFTPLEQTTLAEIVERLDDLESTQDPDSIKNAVEDYLKNNPDSGVVMYTEQSLTDDQKTQARANIGAVTAAEVKEIATVTEPIPSPNLVNINDTESWPFGTSETEAVNGMYSWVDSDGYINIKGTASQSNTIFVMFTDGDTTFEPGTYYICFDDVLRTGIPSSSIAFNGETIYYFTANDDAPQAVLTLTESVTVKKIDLTFQTGATANFRGHCWITKDEPMETYAPKGGTIEVPVTPVTKENFAKLTDRNILGIFDDIGGVGDSLMSGYINVTDSSLGSDTTCYAKSWLTQIKKNIGVDITHYSYQGATAKNWVQNQNGHYNSILTEPCDAYFLALGTNDTADWAGYDGLGTIADMGTDANTFCGWYSKVIARIREANPKAPVFVLSMYWTGYDAYNDAIQAMSEATENAYYIDITDMGEKYSQYRQGYHFNAIGYYYIAKSIIERVSEVIVANYLDFANLGIEA